MSKENVTVAYHVGAAETEAAIRAKLIEMPDGVSIGADCDKNIDAAMQRTSGGEE